jgi:hypothetical protein
MRTRAELILFMQALSKLSTTRHIIEFNKYKLTVNDSWIFSFTTFHCLPWTINSTKIVLFINFKNKNIKDNVIKIKCFH